MQILAAIIVFVGFSLVQNAPSMFYGKEGLEMRRRHGRGSAGVKLLTGVVVFFLAFSVVIMFDPSSSDMSGIGMIVFLGCLLLLGLSAALTRAITKKKMLEEGYISPDAQKRDPEDWRIR